MQTAVITGVTGFLGRELSRQLASAGVRVHGLTRQDPASVPCWPGLQLHHHDGRSESLVELMRGLHCDVVFHLAAMVRREHAMADVAQLVDTNVRFGAQLLEAMRAANVRRIVTAGTYLQHGDSERYRALNLYAATKQAFEAVLEYYCEAFGLRAIRLTCCNIYGKDDARASLIADIAAAFRDRAVLRLRDHEVRVDLVHVEDVAAAFVAAARQTGADSAGLARYSISSGGDVSAGELVSLFERIAGYRIVVSAEPAAPAQRRMPPWRGKPLAGWQPRITLEDGIARLLSVHRGAAPIPNNIRFQDHP